MQMKVDRFLSDNDTAASFQSGRVDMCRPFARPTRNFHRDRTRRPGHVGVVRYGKVQLAQAHQQLHQTFGGAVRQLEQGLDRQTGVDGRLRVQPGLAPTNRRRRRPIVFDIGVVEPDRAVASIGLRAIVIRAVPHPIPLFWRRLASVLPYPHCHPTFPLLPVGPESGDHVLILHQCFSD